MYDRIMRQYGAGQNLTVGASAQTSTAVPQGVASARLSTTGNCHFKIGLPALLALVPVAVTDQLVKASDPTRDIAISVGEEIQCIQDGASTGVLNIIWLTQ